MLPPAESARRLAALQGLLDAQGLAAAVIVQNTDLAYLAGTSQQAHLIAPARGEARLLVRRSLERARAESPLSAVEPLRSLRELRPALAEAGVRAGDAVGFELDVLPASAYLRYVERLPDLELRDCSALVRRVRAVKSEWELERMRRAGEQVAAAAAAVPGLLRAGVPEAEMQAEVEHVLRRAGHQGRLRFRGFNQELHYGQVLAGPSGATPGGSDAPLCGPGPNVVVASGPGDHVLAPGDPVIVDVVGAHDGYLADQTRTFALGPLDGELRRAHGVALEILHEAERALRPGAVPAALFARAEEQAGEAGLLEHFMGAGAGRVRFLGHGIGLEIDELPVLAGGFEEPLEAGTTLAVEPKFVFPGVGAVGVENTYAVTADGCERLTPAPEDLIEA